MSDLAYKRTNVYEKADEKRMKEIFDYAEGYRKFIDGAKTEREACDYVAKAAEAHGYKLSVGESSRPETRCFINTAAKISI